MSVLIKGMEMPKEAGKYRIEFDQCGNPYLLSDNNDGGLWHIISVSPHGRLGDLDELYSRLQRWYQTYERAFSESEVIYIRAMLAGVKETPTIIPAEEGE